MTEVSLPKWAKLGAKHGALQVVDVDADAAYEAWFAELGVDEPPDQYWLEVAYQCIKMELQVAMRTFTFEIHVHDVGKKWAQSKYPKGRGADYATMLVRDAKGKVLGGREAREHFKRLRGFVPS
jgi:hypothetical protein